MMAVRAVFQSLGNQKGPGRFKRVVSVAYLAFAPDLPEPVAGTDAADARWWAVDDVLAVPLERCPGHERRHRAVPGGALEAKE